MTNELCYCPICQAQIEPGKPCWLCQGASTDENVFTRPLENAQPAPVVPAGSRQPESDNPYATPTPIGDTPGAPVASFVLIVGLVIVLGALTVAAPGLGILLSLIVTPALIRTAVVVGRRRRARNQDLSAGEKSTLFFASFAGVLLAAGAAAVAFGITCAATCFGIIALESGGGSRAVESLIFAALALSAIAGLSAGGYTLYLLWRRKT